MSSTKIKRLLLVCYEYGPHNHTGAFRWKSFCKHLSQAGWNIEVVAADFGAGDLDSLSGARVHAVSPRYFLYDWRKRREKRYLESSWTDRDAAEPRIAAGEVKVRKVGKPLSLRAHLRGALSGSFDLLDAWLWTSRARRKAADICKQKAFDVVVATSPLHQTQRVAAHVSGRFKLPYVADYRDPWYFGRGPERVRLDLVSRFFWKKQELQALAQARAAVDIAQRVGQASAAELEAEAAQQARIPRYLIPSGYEPGEAESGPVDPTRFRIAYIGWLWEFMPLPSLLAAVALVCRENPGLAQQLVLELVGVDAKFAGVSLPALVKSYGIESRVEVSQRVSQNEARQKMEAAAVLVAFDSVCAHAICVPSKIYHYARCRGDILAIGGPQGSMALELEKIEVPTISPSDVRPIADRILQSHLRWSSGKMLEANDRDGTLSVVHRVEEMNELLHMVAFGAAELAMLKRLKPKDAP